MISLRSLVILLCAPLICGAQLVETQGWFSRKQTIYTFKMSEDRDVEYVFNAFPGSTDGDLIRLRVDGKIVSVSNALRIEGVMIAPNASVLHLLPRTVRELATRTSSRVILKDYSSKGLDQMMAEAFYPSQDDRNAVRESLGLHHLETYVPATTLPLPSVWDFADFDELYNENEAFKHVMDLSPERLPFLGVREKFAEVASVKRVSRVRKDARTFAVSFPELDEQTDESSPKFIAPNEFDNYIHHRQLEVGEGAVVAVGTIRAFNTAALLKRDLLVCFDYSLAINEANRALIDMIGTLSREDFLREIVGTSRGAVSTRASFATLIDRELRSGRATFATEAGNRLHALLPAPPPGVHGQSVWRLWLTSLREFTLSDEKWNATFFAHDDAYLHMQNLVRNGRAWVVNASLSGPKGLRGLGDKIREHGTFVRELDVSNALEHILSFSGPEGLRDFAANAMSLPVAPSSKLLVTIDARKNTPAWALDLEIGKWIYLVNPLSTESSKIDSLARARVLSDTDLNVALIGRASPNTCVDLFKAM